MKLQDIEISVLPHYNKKNCVMIATYAYIFAVTSLIITVAFTHLYNYHLSHREQIYVFDKNDVYDFNEIEGLDKIIDHNSYKVTVHTTSFNSEYNGLIYLLRRDNYEIKNGRDIIYDDEIVCPDLFAPDNNINLLNIQLEKHKIYEDLYHKQIGVDRNLTLNIVGNYDSNKKINDLNVCYASDNLINKIAESNYSYNTGYNLLIKGDSDRREIIKSLLRKGYDVKSYEDKSLVYENLGTLLAFIVWIISFVMLIKEVNEYIKRYIHLVKSDNFIDNYFLGIELFNRLINQMILFIAITIGAYIMYIYGEYVYQVWYFRNLEYLNINIPFNWLGYTSIVLVVTVYPLISLIGFNIIYYIKCKIHGRIVEK